MMNFSARQRDLAHQLFELGAIRFGAFKLKLHETQPDAPLSPIYLNLRTPDNKGGPLTPEIVRLIGHEFSSYVSSSGITFDHVAGVPRAGDPLAEALVAIHGTTRRGLLRMAKTEGDGRRSVDNIFEGGFSPGDKALVVDDLITHAGSKIETVTVLRARGLEVTDCLVLVDRCQGGSQELFEQTNVQLHRIFQLPDLLDEYVETGCISADQRHEVLAYLRTSVA